MNPLKEVSQHGQAVWLDDIHRDLMTGGKLEQLINEDALCGLTSNPAIFEKAISNSDDYVDDIEKLKAKGLGREEIFEELAVKDVQMAADLFRNLYEESDGRHGYVSIEVNPHLARQTRETVEAGRRLWTKTARPNIFIKVPGTREGLPAITQLLSEGINVNVTLLFGLTRYREVAEAFMTGIEKRLAHGEDVARVRSVASFFLSRIDAELDPVLATLGERGDNSGLLAKKLQGEVAIASAKVAYEVYRKLFTGERWQNPRKQRAQPQWLLWASTSTKNPDYWDVKYVEALIGPETVNTMPMKTLDAYRDHGDPEPRLDTDIESAHRVLAVLSRVGVSISETTRKLEQEGIEKFCKPYDSLIELLGREMDRV